MNINYHYFVIKTLAYTAGFSEEDAQTIAYYSQQVDDFKKCFPMQVRQEPPQFFIEKKYATKMENGLWKVQPHPTGIDVFQSIEKKYRHTTLVPFHFIPAKPLAELEAASDFTRADYRCVRADNENAVLIHQITEEAVEAVQQKKCEKSLMQLGMALHTYADTYAHCGYSGLNGWENRAAVKGTYNQMTGKEEVSPEERFAYQLLPHIGHANSGHVPDVCTFQIDVAMQRDEGDNVLTQHIVRDNLQEFLSCAKEILEILCRAAQSKVYKKISGNGFLEQLAEAMQVETGDEDKVEKLIPHWRSMFPEISYSYDKNERFYQKEQNLSSDNSIMEAPVQAELETMENAIMENMAVYDVTDAFYMYNELAYRRVELVLGTSELLAASAQLLENEQGAPIIMTQYSCNEVWEPKSELGFAVNAAGFTYLPDQDIICSTMNNAQRLGGYCKGYDEAAIVINSVIDCEPIYFCYDGYEWLIELWKGQYGIETGGEIGVYYREQDKPLSIAERTVMGKLYGCVPDERMLDMGFELCKDGEPLFSRGWERHWWLTGFHWGILSEPEQLTMAVGIRFPNRIMQQAFVCQGLEEMGYTYIETDACSVKFCFDTPKTKQPGLREMLRKSAQGTNRELANAYNSIRDKYGITVNDPNVISQVINQKTGIAEKKLYENLVHHLNRKSELKEEVQKHVESL